MLTVIVIRMIITCKCFLFILTIYEGVRLSVGRVIHLSLNEVEMIDV